MLKFFIYLNIIAVIVVHAAPVPKCPAEPFCSCSQLYQKAIIVCNNFTSFEQLDFTDNKIFFEKVHLSPSGDALDFDDKLDLTGLKIDRTGQFKLTNIKSFVLDENPLKNIEIKDEKQKFGPFVIEKSVFRQVYKSKQRECTADGMNDLVENNTFSHTSWIEMIDVSFVEPICPFIFHKLMLNNFKVISTKNDFSFELLPVKLPIEKKNSKKPTFNVYFDNVKIKRLDSMQMQLFTQAKKVVFEHGTTIGQISPDAFENFPYLVELTFDNVDYGQLFAQSGTQWLNPLNSNFTVQLNDTKNIKESFQKKKIVKVEFKNFDKYQFPGKDFCLFQNYPFEKLILPVLDSKVPCSCTVLWLMKFTEYYVHIQGDWSFGLGNEMAYCVNECECDFELALSSCKSENSYNKKIGSDPFEIKCRPPTTTTPTTTTEVVVRRKNDCPDYCKCLQMSNNTSLNLVCTDFDSFGQLNFSNYKSQPIELLELYPKIELDLDSSLSLTELYLNDQTDVKLANIKSIQISSNPFKKQKIRTLSFLNSKILFKQQDNSFDCYITADTLFSAASSLQFLNVQLPEPLCLLVFQKTKLDSFVVELQEGGKFQFQSMKPNQEHLYCFIDNFSLKNANIQALDYPSVLNREVFLNVKKIQLEKCQIDSIENETFTYFSQLKQIDFIDMDTTGVFKQTKWIDSINSKQNVDLNKTELVKQEILNKNFVTIGFNRTNGFDFRDEDFCLFADYPFSKLIFMKFEPKQKCTCTLEWLSRYQDEKICTGASDKCDFEGLLSSCHPNTTESASKLQSNKKKMSPSVITGIVFAVVFVVGSIIAIVGFIVYKRSQNTISTTTTTFDLNEFSRISTNLPKGMKKFS